VTGVRAGQVLSREIEPPSRKRWPLLGADLLNGAKAELERRYREMLLDLARSKTLCMHASTLSGSREIRVCLWEAQTASESPRRTPMMARPREVGQTHSTYAAAERGRA